MIVLKILINFICPILHKVKAHSKGRKVDYYDDHYDNLFNLQINIKVVNYYFDNKRDTRAS